MLDKQMNISQIDQYIERLYLSLFPTSVSTVSGSKGFSQSSQKGTPLKRDVQI